LTSHFQDGGHDVISRRKVPPPGEASAVRQCSNVRQFLIYSTVLLIIITITIITIIIIITIIM